MVGYEPTWGGSLYRGINKILDCPSLAREGSSREGKSLIATLTFVDALPARGGDSETFVTI